MAAQGAKKSAVFLIVLLLLPLLYALIQSWFPVYGSESELLAAVRKELAMEADDPRELSILGRAKDGERVLFVVGRNDPNASALSLSCRDYLPVYCSEFNGGLVLEHISNWGMYEASGSEGPFYYTGLDGFAFLVLNPACASIAVTGSGGFSTREIAVPSVPFFHYEGGVFGTADGDYTYSFRFFSKDGEEL